MGGARAAFAEIQSQTLPCTMYIVHSTSMKRKNIETLMVPGDHFDLFMVVCTGMLFMQSQKKDEDPIKFCTAAA